MVAGVEPDAVRRAMPADASELTRLRERMFADMGRVVDVDDTWRQLNIEHFRNRLLDVERFAAVVVDGPSGGLVSCAVGWLNPHLIGLRNMSGRTGYVANVSTDVAFRRRGYGRSCLVALLEWMRSTGIGIVHLHASRDGDSLYRSSGFTEPSDPVLTLRL